MGKSKTNSIITFAVRVGSLLLVTPIVYIVIYNAFEILSQLLSEPSTQLSNIVAIASLILGVYVSHEVSLTRLRGISVLGRGSASKQLFRHFLLGVPTIAGGIVLVNYIIRMISVGISSGSTTSGFVGSLFAIVLVGLFIINYRAFKQGLSES